MQGVILRICRKFILIFFPFLLSCLPQPANYNPNKELCVCTQVTKIGEFYFLVDCYNNQVIYSKDLTAPIPDWQVMTGDIQKGHTVASDGRLYLVDDTEGGRVLVFIYNGYSFECTQVIENVGVRPHYIVYNEADASFYVWSSMTGQMYVYKAISNANEVRIDHVMMIKELDGIYVRSFTIEGDSVYLVSGNQQIIEARITDFKIMNRYPVPDSMAGMVQILPINGGYYITISTDANGDQKSATVLYTERLSDLAAGKYVDLYAYFIGGGTPYYLGEINGTYYLTEHRIPGYNVWAFDIGEDHLPTNQTRVQ